MRLFRQIPPDTCLRIYRALRDFLRGHDDILFEAMAVATSGERHSFIVPTNVNDFEKKHTEIEKMLSIADLIRTRWLPFRFMLEVCRLIEAQSGALPANLPEDVRNAINLAIPGQELHVRINQSLEWEASWRVRHRAMDFTETLSLVICDSNLNEIVPAYVVEYVNTAVGAYNQNFNATAAALLSISVEATLRDVLSSRGYSFTPGAVSVDTFKYTTAEVTVAGAAYQLSFPETNLKPIADNVG